MADSIGGAPRSYWDGLVRHLGGVVDVGKHLGKHPSILSNYRMRGYSLPSRLELMALAVSRNVPMPDKVLTVTVAGKTYRVEVVPVGK